MARLRDLAVLVRSKNAGPFLLTFDFVFADATAYARVRDAGVLTPALFAQRYNVPAEAVRIVAYPEGLALKVTLPRPVPSGAVEDRDVFGGQFFAPLVDLEIP